MICKKIQNNKNARFGPFNAKNTIIYLQFFKCWQFGDSWRYVGEQIVIKFSAKIRKLVDVINRTLAYQEEKVDFLANCWNKARLKSSRRRLTPDALRSEWRNLYLQNTK